MLSTIPMYDLLDSIAQYVPSTIQLVAESTVQTLCILSHMYKQLHSCESFLNRNTNKANNKIMQNVSIVVNCSLFKHWRVFYTSLLYKH